MKPFPEVGRPAPDQQLELFFQVIERARRQRSPMVPIISKLPLPDKRTLAVVRDLSGADAEESLAARVSQGDHEPLLRLDDLRPAVAAFRSHFGFDLTPLLHYQLPTDGCWHLRYDCDLPEPIVWTSARQGFERGQVRPQPLRRGGALDLRRTKRRKRRRRQ